MRPANGVPSPTPKIMSNPRPATETTVQLHIDEHRVTELMVLLSDLGLINRSLSEHGELETRSSVTDEVIPTNGRRVSPQRLLEIWRMALNREIEPNLADLLCIEFWASLSYSEFAQELSSASGRFTYAKTLLAIRKRAAYSVYEYARRLNWFQPVTYVLALKVARAYLRDAAGHGDAYRWDDYGQFAGKLGVSTVLISGFEQVSLDDADEAYQAIRCSLEYGNDSAAALPYLVDAAVLRFDFNKDSDQLNDAVALAQQASNGRDLPNLWLSIAQAKLRIALRSRNKEMIEEVANLVNKAESTSDGRVVEFLIITIIRGIVSHLHSSTNITTEADGLKIPFGYRTGQEVHPLLIASAREIFREIRLSNRSDDPMVARILSDLVVNARDGLGISELQAMEASVRYRSIELDTNDLPSRLVRLHDRLRLANLAKNDALRNEATYGLAELADDSRATAAVRMILAGDVETSGRLNLSNTNTLSSSPVRTNLDHMVALAEEGDFLELWRLAAESALTDANLTQIDLGGRSGVKTVGDYYGLVSEALVYKQMDEVSFERGSERAKKLHDYIIAHGYQDEFGVLFNLGTSRVDDKVVVARRYISGYPVMQLMEEKPESERRLIVCKVARFLGVINKAEADMASGRQVRNQLKSKEVGRFLRSCGIADYLTVFNKWWAIVEDVDKVTRRDSHLDNWLLAEDGKLVAIDLEAIGSRPIGYDLAQMTDDHPYFEPEDWKTRKAIFDIYMDQIDVTSDYDECWRSYKAGVLARMLWAITSPERATWFEPGVAEDRLLRFASTVCDKELADIAWTALRSLLEQRGLSSLPTANRHTTGAGRIRLSKQIAFFLRHELTIDRDSSGWVEMEVLQKRIPNVTLDEIATIATDPREPRFELDGGRIRAKYGHNVKLNLILKFDDNLSPSTVLYHASPWKNASAILDARVGLRAQSRGMVHLADSLDEAVANGVRGGHPLLYETRVADVPAILKAGGHTYLAPSVSADGLTVVPLSSYWKSLPAIKISGFGL